MGVLSRCAPLDTSLLPLVPGFDDPLKACVQLRVKILLVGMFAKPGDGLADADAKGFEALELGNKAFDLAVVKDCRMRFVSLEIPGHVRFDLANELSGYFEHVAVTQALCRS